MTNEWGFLIVLYLFFGGLSAGLLVLSASATLADEARYERVARMGAWMAPWPVLAGTALLVLDLGQPFYFWKLLLAFQPHSPMWYGTWLLTMFSLVSLPFANLFLPAILRIWAPAGAARRRRQFAYVALPLGIGVAVYTGILLGLLVARPLWNTAWLPYLFLVSAVSSAAALLLLLLRGVATDAERHLLARGDAVLIAVELLLLAAGIVAWRSSGAIAVLQSATYGSVFWIGVVGCGLVVPFVFETIEAVPALRRIAGPRAARGLTIAPALVLAGGFLLRWVIVYAGQVSALPSH